MCVCVCVCDVWFVCLEDEKRKAMSKGSQVFAQAQIVKLVPNTSHFHITSFRALLHTLIQLSMFQPPSPSQLYNLDQPTIIHNLSQSTTPHTTNTLLSPSSATPTVQQTRHLYPFVTLYSVSF